MYSEKARVRKDPDKFHVHTLDGNVRYSMLIIVFRFSTETSVNTSVMCSQWDQVLAQYWVSWL